LCPVWVTSHAGRIDWRSLCRDAFIRAKPSFVGALPDELVERWLALRPWSKDDRSAPT
jgi:hypothetical protein